MTALVESETSNLVPKPALARELGVCNRTISRWMADPALAFPRPIRLRNRLYFARPALEAWKTARVRASIMEAAE
jgi:predicted DNA-binding transcriptional regulator AlpA